MIPVSENIAEIEAAIVMANRILAHHGVLDAFGHVSARHPTLSDRFIISRTMAPANVTAADLMHLQDDGTPVGNDARRPFLERFIHSSIYRARPDVKAIVHSHSPVVIPFSVVNEAPLRPIFHMAGFIGAKAPIFEIREFAGDASDMLVRTGELGDGLAKCLGNSTVVLMRGHGSTCVGGDVRQVVFRAIYLAVNAQIQSAASMLGNPTFLNAEEAANADKENSGQIDRAWALWCSEVNAPGPQ
ncbi:MAG: class II aldolase/adducin family protein [Pseudomonadota bacterium]|nr:class II aldolase/adducin family protein [Pseudomonadota bacterium]